MDAKTAVALMHLIIATLGCFNTSLICGAILYVFYCLRQERLKRNREMLARIRMFEQRWGQAFNLPNNAAGKDS